MILYIASACSVYNLTIKPAFTVLMPHHRSILNVMTASREQRWICIFETQQITLEKVCFDQYQYLRYFCIIFY